MRRSALLTASAFIGLASIVAAGATASASARASIAPKAAAVSTFTLNLVGTPIVVGVTTDPAGNLVDATVTPATGFTPTAVMPNKVRFENSTTGTSVTVKANHGGQSVTARASSLATLVSTANGWTGDVFGNGVTTKVTFDIATLADGVSPDIKTVKVLPDCTTGVAPAMTCVVGATTYGDDEDDNEGTEASASVKFSLLGQTRTLRIRVGTHTEDGVTSAAVRISLSKIKGGMTVVVGTAQTWTGTLCDGTTVASFGYLVDATTNAVSITTAPTPAAEVKNNENGVEVRFANGPRVRIGVKHDDGGAAVPSLTVKFKCEAGIPTIGGLPADPTIVNQGGHGDQGGHGGGDGGNNNGGGDNKGND